MHQKNSSKDMELTQDRSYKQYSESVAEVLKAYYSHSLRNLPDNFDKLVADWSNLFIKVGIPASRLMDVYLEAHMNLERGEYFNADTIIATWNDNCIERLQEELKEEVCTICKGEKTAIQYNFKLKEDVQVDCPVCA